MKTVYLDHAATTPTDPEVVEAMLPYFTEVYANPSSLHRPGSLAREGLEAARATVASFIGAARPDEIVFTSGGTESDNTALKGLAQAKAAKGNHIITSAIEHHAVLEPCHFLEKQGFSVTYVPVDSQGLVDPDDVAKAITDKTIAISVMHANNEIGTIQPIAEIGRIARERGIAFHTDAVQTVGRVGFKVDELGVDMLSASAHKFYGPKGVGFLYARKGTRFASFMQGGDQEKRRRASTHNVSGIVGLAKAIELAAVRWQADAERQTALRDRLIKGIFDRIPDVHLNGHATARLPNNVNISVAYTEGESMLLSLDMEGIACSTGSACSSSSLEPSHVLLATGMSHELAHGSLRFSLGRATTEADIDTVLDVLPRVATKLRGMSPLCPKRYKEASS